MSTIALRVAEIEARLHSLRRRINAFRAQHVAYVGASVLIVIVALLIVAGLQAPPQVFRVAAWVCAALATLVVAASLLTLSSGWIDDSYTAKLADREAGLADRLSTLIGLRARSQSSRLEPVLVAQTLDLGDRWRPERIAPRRIPRSVFVLLASLFLLASTAFIQKRGLDMGAVGQEKDGTLDFDEDAPPQPERRQPRGREEARGDNPDQMEGRGSPDGSEVGVGGLEGMPEEATYDGSAPLEGVQLSQLPDRLQDAIRRAFDAEPMDSLRALGSGAGSNTSGERREGVEGGLGEDTQKRRSEPGSGQRQARGEAQQPPAQKPHPGNWESTGAEKVGRRRDMPHGKPGDFSGSSPGAGEGPGSVPPIGAVPDLGAGGVDAAPFKLTIRSFLAAVERQGMPQWKPGAGSAPAASGGEATSELSDNQLNDDALRKAEIPAEYEDVVRRAYSAGK